MSIAITEDHRALADTAADLLAKRVARGAARALLEAPDEPLPDLWKDLAGLGWLRLHIPEEHGGPGFPLEELAVVLEALGRAVAPGPFVPSVIASAVIPAGGHDATPRHPPHGPAHGPVVGAAAPGGAAP